MALPVSRSRALTPKPPPRRPDSRRSDVSFSVRETRVFLFLCIACLAAFTGRAWAGGGVILQADACIIEIGFYRAHFTAYQPQTSGNTEFCEDLPDLGESIFVLDYLHDSLKLVPLEFRIIHDTTGLGEFVQIEDVQAIDDIEAITVYYRPPAIESNGSYRVNFDFLQKGDYIGVVSAGHPTNSNIYYSVFPFSVAATRYPYWILYLFVAGLFAYLIRYAYLSSSDRDNKE